MVQTITPLEAQELIQRNEVDVVDVREPNEWSGGRLPGSRLVPLGQLRQSPKQALPRDGVIFVCGKAGSPALATLQALFRDKKFATIIS